MSPMLRGSVQIWDRIRSANNVGPSRPTWRVRPVCIVHKYQPRSRWIFWRWQTLQARNTTCYAYKIRLRDLLTLCWRLRAGALL